MREFGKVGVGFWDSPVIQSLSDDGKLLALYLVTSTHSNAAGIYRCPDGYVVGDLKWSTERVTQGFDELSRKGFATRCSKADWVVIVKHFKHNPIENPNQAKHVLKLLEQVPTDATIVPLILKVLRGNHEHFPTGWLERFTERFANRSRRVSKQGEGEGERDGKGEGEGKALRGGSRKPRDPPPLPTKATKLELSEERRAHARAIWTAYVEAYAKRYGVEPTRNRTVNGQVVSFLDRVPAADGPGIAAFFVRSNEPFYVRGGHAFGLLLKDAEKLRTAWQRSANGVTDPLAGLSSAGRQTAENLRDFVSEGEPHGAR